MEMDRDTKRSSALVGDVMTVDPIIVSVDATVEQADLLLRSTFITGIPVVDRDGRLVGTISHAELVAYRFGVRPSDPVTGQTRSNAIATDPPPPRQRVASP